MRVFVDGREIELMAGTGAGIERLLHGATALPRTLWGRPPTGIVPGVRAELVLLDRSPMDDVRALRRVAAVYRNGWDSPLEQRPALTH